VLQSLPLRCPQPPLPERLTLLALKLLLVPAFLLIVSLAGKRWGASIAGWLAGLPVVAGPILFFIAMEQGVPFAARAAVLSLSAVFASLAFSLAYAHAAQRLAWPVALLAGLCAWGGAALGLSLLFSLLPASAPISLAIAALSLLVAPRLFPQAPVQAGAHQVGPVEIGCRMAAGAALTVAVTWVAGGVGTAWSGLLAVFPVLGGVLAVFSHRMQGAGFASALLRGMATGMASFVGFCFVLAMALPSLGVAAAFSLAALASLAVQAGTRRWLGRA
jgi:hypothetical protein